MVVFHAGPMGVKPAFQGMGLRRAVAERMGEVHFHRIGTGGGGAPPGFAPAVRL